MTILEKLRPSKFLKFKKKPDLKKPPALEPRIYARGEHNLSRNNIAESALKVLYRLHKAGFEAYLVGGAVRDCLLGMTPKDFDVATNALPEEVCELFRNSRLIGRRFKLVHVRFGREIIEVATFRASHDGQAEGAAVSEEGRILRDNVYGDLVDDVWRRDFTINALYYNIADYSIVDYVGGMADLQNRKLRLIGDADVRYCEDPMRLLRAIRFAAKLSVNLDADTQQAFAQYGHLLQDISSARMFDEIVKLFHCGASARAFELLLEYQLVDVLFPAFQRLEKTAMYNDALVMINKATQNTDERLAENKSVTPAFVFAALLWHAQLEQLNRLKSKDMPAYEKELLAYDRAIEEQLSRIAIPRRFTSYVREIWSLQKKFEKRTPKRVARLFEHRRFRTAYDFLLLRNNSGEKIDELAAWWTAYEQGSEQQRAELVAKLGVTKPKKRRKRKATSSGATVRD